MGNCLKHGSSSMTRTGDDLGSPAAWEKMVKKKGRRQRCYAYDIAERTPKIEEEDEEKSQEGKAEIYSPAATTEVKIKISKKQLQELLGRVDVDGLSVEQVVAQLMNLSDRYETQQQPWRPALQSIPEVN